jgi:hypothetical protein
VVLADNIPAFDMVLFETADEKIVAIEPHFINRDVKLRTLGRRYKSPV